MLKLPGALSRASTIPPVFVKRLLSFAFTTTKMISIATPSVAFFPIPDAFSRAFTIIVVVVKNTLSYALIIAKNISLNTLLIARHILADAVAVTISEVAIGSSQVCQTSFPAFDWIRGWTCSIAGHRVVNALVLAHVLVGGGSRLQRNNALVSTLVQAAIAIPVALLRIF